MHPKKTPRPGRPGHKPATPRTEAKVIKVSLANQTLEAWNGATRVFAFDCVTGASDHPTEPGTFHVLRKDRNHHSHAYDVDMHFALFFSTDGKAIHQYHGIVPLWIVRGARSGSDWFGSHGCVRLTEDDAHALYDWTPLHTPVIIA
jgi:lipoprotein-anchoring transpeptidase ErfK/SrfK